MPKAAIKDKAADNQRKNVRPIDRTSVRPGQNYIVNKDVLIPHGVTLDQCLDPAYWQNASQDIKVGHELRLRAEDETWVAWCYVHAKRGYNVSLTVIKHIEIEGGNHQQIEIDGYLVKWNGQREKWIVLDPQKNVIARNHASRNSALKAVENHQAAM